MMKKTVTLQVGRVVAALSRDYQDRLCLDFDLRPAGQMDQTTSLCLLAEEVDDFFFIIEAIRQEMS